ncbi:tetrahydrofolate dehydrogenase/cyclohydrolase catalytic domain-containing protein [Malacoplasma muris]|uniref:tetrahydrofolate dehydrogenase/cyclohydrolase catalytic domain-containing protein n=1 Tax=Malacoplasma muris TaxID=2119 RepID=UPI00398F32D1
MIIDCLKIAKNIKNNLIVRINKFKEKYKLSPKIAFLITNNNDSGKKFLERKIKIAKELGIAVEVYDQIKIEKDLFNIIKKLNNDNSVHGIVVQLPIFKGANIKTVFSSINPRKDVDGLNPLSIGNLILEPSNTLNIPCTVKSIISILDSLQLNYEGKNALIINRSHIVGKPLIHNLLEKNMTVTISHSYTNNLDQFIKNADLIISGCNVANIVNISNVKKESILINVGATYFDNKIVGDIDFDNLKDYVSYITPIIGGVGPLTVLNVFDNLMNLIESNYFG